jgi:hypothetical protein
VDASLLRKQSQSIWGRPPSSLLPGALVAAAQGPRWHAVHLHTGIRTHRSTAWFYILAADCAASTEAKAVGRNGLIPSQYDEAGSWSGTLLHWSSSVGRSQAFFRVRKISSESLNHRIINSIVRWPVLIPGRKRRLQRKVQLPRLVSVNVSVMYPCIGYWGACVLQGNSHGETKMFGYGIVGTIIIIALIVFIVKRI